MSDDTLEVAWPERFLPNSGLGSAGAARRYALPALRTLTITFLLLSIVQSQCREEKVGLQLPSSGEVITEPDGQCSSHVVEVVRARTHRHQGYVPSLPCCAAYKVALDRAH